MAVLIQPGDIPSLRHSAHANPQELTVKFEGLSKPCCKRIKLEICGFSLRYFKRKQAIGFFNLCEILWSKVLGEKIRRMTPKVLIRAKLLLANPNPNPTTVPWSVPGTLGSLGAPKLMF